MNAIQMNLNASANLKPQNERPMALYHLVDEYKRGMLQLPDHQREWVWDNEKKRRWIKRLKNNEALPVGMFLTYQLDNGKPSPIFINDGSQRIRTTLEYLENPNLYGDTEEEAENIVRIREFPVQHRWYVNHDQALIDFQLINLGTHLTPLEFCKGVLSYLEPKEMWRPMLEELHDIVSSASHRITSRKYSLSRLDEHKRQRDDYALFHRLVTKNKRTDNYRVSVKQVKFEDVHNKKVIEWLLRDVFEAFGYESMQKKIPIFRALIDRETSLVENIWHEKIGKSQGDGINQTLFRWILHCSIWKRNNNVPNHIWEDFLFKLLSISNGKSQVVKMEDGIAKYSYTLSLGNLSALKGVNRIIESTFVEASTQKRKRRRTNNKPGIDNSHELPFAKDGDGPTFPEPGGLNRSRGATPVED